MDGRDAGDPRARGRIRRALDRIAGPDTRAAAPPPSPDREGSDVKTVLRQLERRLAHVEQELQGLQDSIHRESCRRDEQIAELRHQLRPEEIARSMSDDARRRGI